MLLVRTELKESNIHGIGLFAKEFIPKNTIIWRFTPGFDLKFSKEQILILPDLLKIYICKYAWKSTKSKLYCFSSDNGKFFNHSNNPNTNSFYKSDEEEVITIAIRDIKIGDEITDNYESFEKNIEDDNILVELSRIYKLNDELDPRIKNNFMKIQI
jgi:uncharacterized protein